MKVIVWRLLSGCGREGLDLENYLCGSIGVTLMKFYRGNSCQPVKSLETAGSESLEYASPLWAAALPFDSLIAVVRAVGSCLPCYSLPLL
jgi:hypothetical protein